MFISTYDVEDLMEPEIPEQDYVNVSPEFLFDEVEKELDLNELIDTDA